MKATWPSEHVLLGLLCERPMHGYELAQTARNDEAMCAIWRFERSEVYFLLGKLVQKGYVTRVAVDQAGGPARTIYGPSDAGRAVLMDWLHTPERQPRNLRTSLLARVHVALRLDPHIAVELIDLQKQTLTDWLASQKSHIAKNEVVDLVRRLRVAQVQATLGALDELRAMARARMEEFAQVGYEDRD
jgi:DNA-binding PadR family transcriptional regulator